MFTCQLLHRDARLRGVCRQVLKYLKGDRQARVDAQQYALSVGVPESQLDWGE